MTRCRPSGSARSRAASRRPRACGAPRARSRACASRWSTAGTTATAGSWRRAGSRRARRVGSLEGSVARDALLSSSRSSPARGGVFLNATSLCCPFSSVGLVSSSHACLVVFVSRSEAYAELLHPWRVAAHNESLGFPLTDSARCALPAPPPSAAAVWLFARAPSSTLRVGAALQPLPPTPMTATATTAPPTCARAATRRLPATSSSPLAGRGHHTLASLLHVARHGHHILASLPRVAFCGGARDFSLSRLVSCLLRAFSLSRLVSCLLLQRRVPARRHDPARRRRPRARYRVRRARARRRRVRAAARPRRCRDDVSHKDLLS